MNPLPGALVLVLALAACREDKAAGAPPVRLTDAAMGRYCGMNLMEHEGPKGQVVMAAGMDPFWFSSARDAIAFTMMPDEPKDYAAVYVSDMGRAESWAQPGADNWTDARTAVYVVGSDMKGGMGADELVPFSDAGAAEAFARDHGGSVKPFDRLAPAEVLGDGAMDMQAEGTDHAHH